MTKNKAEKVNYTILHKGCYGNIWDDLTLDSRYVHQNIIDMYGQHFGRYRKFKKSSEFA